MVTLLTTHLLLLLGGTAVDFAVAVAGGKDRHAAKDNPAADPDPDAAAVLRVVGSWDHLVAGRERTEDLFGSRYCCSAAGDIAVVPAVGENLLHWPLVHQGR